MKDDLKRTIDALLEAHQHLASISTDDRMIIAEEVASALRQKRVLNHFEFDTWPRKRCTITTDSLSLTISAAPASDEPVL